MFVGVKMSCTEKNETHFMFSICFPWDLQFLRWLNEKDIMYIYTGYTQKNGVVSKVNKKFISHRTRSQCTPSAAVTVQVSHALPAVCFSCLLQGLFPRWRLSRKRLSVCSVLRCPDLWLQCSMSYMHGLEKTHHAGIT